MPCGGCCARAGAASCQVPKPPKRPGLGFWLDFACGRMGPSLECQVLSTLPGFPLETKPGMKCPIAAAAPGLEFPAQTFCKAGRDAQSCSGDSQRWDPKPLTALVCPWGQGSEGIPFSWIAPHQGHRAPAITDTGGRWSLVREREQKGKCHPSSSATGSGSVGGGSSRFPHGSLRPQELFLTHLKIHPVKHPQNFGMNFSNVP